MNEGNSVPSGLQSEGISSNQHSENASKGMNVQEFLDEVDQVNKDSFKSERKKVDLKEVTYNPKPGKLPEEGEELRIVPPLEGKAFQKIDFHWKIGNSKMVVCPSQYDRPCPICDYLKTQPSDDKTKQMEAKTRYFLPVIIRKREQEGPKWWGFPKTVLNIIASLYKNKYYGDVSDIYEGNDLEIKFPADADVANITPVPIKSPLMVDDLGAPNDENIKTLRSLVKPLNEVFIELPHDAIVKILDKANGSVQD
jgi:hypothetical protein